MIVRIHYWRIKMKNRKIMYWMTVDLYRQFKLFLLLLKSLVLLFFVLLNLERKKQIISMTSIHICLWKQCDSDTRRLSLFSHNFFFFFDIQQNCNSCRSFWLYPRCTISYNLFTYRLSDHRLCILLCIYQSSFETFDYRRFPIGML